MIATTILDFSEGTWGEDRFCVLDRFCCVLDGATPIKQEEFAGYHSSAEWLADQLIRRIPEGVAASVPYPLICQGFVKAEADIRHAFRDDYQLPCLTTAAMQQDGNLLTCWVLGDCSVYLLMKDGKVRHITDNRVTRFSEKSQQAKNEAIRRGEDPTAAVLAQRIRNKSMMNHPGGYWTVGFTGNFAEEFVECRVEAEKVQAALLCTDGLDRLFIHHGIAPVQLLTEEIALNEAVVFLRQRERTSAQTELKRHDDIAAILWQNS